MSGNPRIDGAEKRWEAYRNDLTEYVVKDAKQGEKVLVIGAGACDDLDLERLLEEDRQVFLLDCNSETLEKAVSKVKKKENVHTICKDVAGLTEAQVTAFQKACEEGSSELEKWKEAYDLRVRENPGFRELQEILEPYEDKKFDRIICMGFHSQVYMPLILTLQKEHYSLSVRQQVQRIAEQLNRSFAEESLEAMKQYGGIIYLGYEYTTFLREDAALREEAIERLSEQGSAGLHRMRLSRVEGAYQLEQELGKAYEKQELQIADCVYMLWPFSEEKSYLMVIFRIL